MDKLRLGLALTGSYCSFGKLDAVLPALADRFQLIPILSEHAREDSRFGSGTAWLSRLEAVCGRAPILTIHEAEPLGPSGALDVLAILPCTGNTLGKLAHGITDTAVTMAAKGHLRNGKPLLLGVSTNDGLGASAENIGRLLVRKHIYFVPFGQDDPVNKPTSLSLDYDRILPAVEAAREGRQLQPVLIDLPA